MIMFGRLVLSFLLGRKVRQETGSWTFVWFCLTTMNHEMAAMVLRKLAARVMRAEAGKNGNTADRIVRQVDGRLGIWS